MKLSKGTIKQAAEELNIPYSTCRYKFIKQELPVISVILSIESEKAKENKKAAELLEQLSEICNK